MYCSFISSDTNLSSVRNFMALPQKIGIFHLSAQDWRFPFNFLETRSEKLQTPRSVRSRGRLEKSGANYPSGSCIQWVSGITKPRCDGVLDEPQRLSLCVGGGGREQRPAPARPALGGAAEARY
jgi:hypothetical protein